VQKGSVRAGGAIRSGDVAGRVHGLGVRLHAGEARAHEIVQGAVRVQERARLELSVVVSGNVSLAVDREAYAVPAARCAEIQHLAAGEEEGVERAVRRGRDSGNLPGVVHVVTAAEGAADRADVVHRAARVQERVRATLAVVRLTRDVAGIVQRGPEALPAA